MRRRTFFRLIRRFLACLIISAVFWSWIFNFLTDAGPEQKILLYADMRDIRWKELAITLEEDLPEGIRWVQVHPFSYAMVNSSEVEQADLYVLTAAQAEERAGWLQPVPTSLAAGRETLDRDGVAIGLRLDPAGAAYFRFEESGGAPWYLCFGKKSLHNPDLPGAADEAALQTARRLLALDSGS